MRQVSIPSFSTTVNLCDTKDMLNLNSFMIGTMQPDILAAFYGKVFDKAPDMADGGWFGWQLGNCFLTIGEHSEMGGQAKDPGRIMFNLEVNDVQEEARRVAGTGAKVIKAPYEMGEGSGMWVATFADPDGNYFQLMTPWE
jgi:predicted enzyme related to lactoylglutathione lyase